MENKIEIKEDILKTLVGNIKGFYKHNIVKRDLENISGGYQNIIYSYKYENKKYIIRLSDEETRSKEMLEAELEWIVFLKNLGVKASAPLKSVFDTYIQDIKLDGFKGFFVVFNMAIGEKIGYSTYLESKELFKDMGSLMGKIHKLSKGYTPKLHLRNDYRSNVYIKELDSVLSKEIIDIKTIKHSLLNDLEKLPKNINNYGLIHGDFNIGNFVILNNEIEIFDFDECQYSWYAEDIAIAIYYTIYVFGNSDRLIREDVSKVFISQFLKGYLRENTLTTNDLSLIVYFLKIRELIVFTACYKKWNMDKLSLWQSNFYCESKKRIENNQPIINNDIIMNKDVLTLLG